jgi:uncharacterized protein
MPITALYAGLLAILLIVLSARVINGRQSGKVEIGTANREGENKELLRRVRVHANFVEYTPFALILIGLAESLKGPGYVLHGLGAALLVGRIVHAYGFSQPNSVMALRVGGMVLTFLSIGGAAALCLWLVAMGK